MSQLILADAAGTVVNYDFHRHTSSAVVYIGANHTDLLEDSVTISSVAPTRKATDYGNRRSRSNLQVGIEVAGPTVAAMHKNAKLELIASVPVGMTLAQFKELAARQAALLSSDEYLKKIFITGQAEM